jgi:hypothetical protein
MTIKKGLPELPEPPKPKPVQVVTSVTIGDWVEYRTITLEGGILPTHVASRAVQIMQSVYPDADYIHVHPIH